MQAPGRYIAHCAVRRDERDPSVVGDGVFDRFGVTEADHGVQRGNSVRAELATEHAAERHRLWRADKGEPPWLFGRTPLALDRGFFHAHLGWLFNRDRTNADRFAPDLKPTPTST